MPGTRSFRPDPGWRYGCGGEGTRPREYWVGGSTVATLVANAVAPGLLDRYLARTAFDAQQEAGREREEAARYARYDGHGNLWSPADGPHGHDYGAHGRFDGESLPGSSQEWVSRNRGRMGAGLAVGGALALALRLKRTPLAARALRLGKEVEGGL